MAVTFGRLDIQYADGRKAQVLLTKRQMVIGRASDSDIQVNDNLVSRRHALLLCGPEGVRVVDAGSANGTFLGSTRLPAQQPIPLPDGAQLRVGHTHLRFVAAADAGEAVADDEPAVPSAPGRPEEDTSIKPPAPPAEPPPTSVTDTRPPSFSPPPPPPEAPAEPEPAHRPSTPPGVPSDRSSYLKYLPPIYANDDFIGRFLLIFEHILGPIERTIHNIPYYLDPSMTPADFLPWLASWLGLVLDERWPEAQRRALIAAAVELYQWRGTRRGLREFLQLYTGFTPEIEEPGVGANARRGEDVAFRFVVRIRVPDPSKIDRAVLEAIIDAEKPAHAGYTLEIVAG